MGRGRGKGPAKRFPRADQLPRVNYDRENAAFSFQYIDHGPETVHSWSADELRALVEMCRKACCLSWLEIRRSGGKGGKTGLGYTLLQNPPFSLPSAFSEDESVAEMRVTQKIRVFGVRRQRTFYIFRLDRAHKTFS